MYVQFFVYTVATLPESISSEHQMPANVLANKGIFLWRNYVYMYVP